jgi:hypothetical protein
MRVTFSDHSSENATVRKLHKRRYLNGEKMESTPYLPNQSASGKTIYSSNEKITAFPVCRGKRFSCRKEILAK